MGGRQGEPVLERGACPVSDAEPLPCPSKGKRKFKTRREAEASLTTIWRHGSRNGPGPLPCRSYLCRCGHWHLTSKPRDYLRALSGELISELPTPNPMTEETCSDQAS